MTSVDLDAVDFVHGGTGQFTMQKYIVEPSSVAGSGALAFTTVEVRYRTMLYQIADAVVPNWFAVAIPEGVTDFSRPTIYFHPSPGQANYLDTDYASKSGKWKEIFAYAHRLGSQLAAAVKLGATPNQIVIIPILKSAATDTGIFKKNWQSIVSDILTDVRSLTTGVGGAITLSEVAVASFSNGFVYSDAFRSQNPSLSSLLVQVIDFDGVPVPGSIGLATVPGKYRAIKYSEGARPGSIALPLGRWAGYQQPPPREEPNLPLHLKEDGSVNDTTWVHHLIRDTMFFAAAIER